MEIILLGVSLRVGLSLQSFSAHPRFLRKKDFRGIYPEAVEGIPNAKK
jgi:hypothetical protein